jgi:hypothetical protein
MKSVKFLAIAMLVLLPLSQAGARVMAVPQIRQSMTVDEAYKAIPHKQTRFDAGAAGMEAREKEFLDALFGLTDIAVAERVEAQIALSTHKTPPSNYDEILRRFQSLPVPEKMTEAHRLVTEAVREQRQYLDTLKGGGTFDANAPLVESSHQKLIQAYNELMRLYPSENAHNKQAFFDHLCALDFK